jgi:putative ABC transport system permease protein
MSSYFTNRSRHRASYGRVTLMNDIWRDIRLAVRSLRKTPGFLAVVILTLGLGIGANAAIFSLTDQILLRPLAVHDPSSLVLLDGPGAFLGRTMNAMTFSYPMYRDLRDRNEVFTGVIGRFPLALTAVWRGASERANGDLVSGNYFEVLGVQPALGRLFNASDDRTPGAHPIAVLSYGYWQRKFGGDPLVLNQTITVNGHPLTIVGVSDRRFTGIQIGSAVDIMVPMMMKAQMTPTWNDLDNRRSRWLNVMARLKPGVSTTQAAAAMNVIYRQINEQEITVIPNASESFRNRFTSKHLDVLPGQKGLSDLRSQFSTPLIVLMSMVGVVLLISCANVANLLLARTTARQKEISLRLALGANRARIVRQQFVESGLLAFAGTIVGLVLAWWTGAMLIRALPGDPGARTLSADPDLRVTMFALAVGLLTAFVFGIVPALQATRTTVTSALKEDSGSVSGGGRQARLRRTLVIAQVALSMLLLAGAGLFARSLYNLKAVDPGFRVDDLLAFSIDPSLSGYEGDRLTALYQRLQEELTALPGVHSVSMSENGTLTGNDWQMTIRVDGYRVKEGEDMNPRVDGVGPRYFETMGIPLVSGREFTDRDVKGAPQVAIINETMAKYFFEGSSPVGRRLGFARGSATDIEIVGVVKDVRSLELRDRAPRFLYIPYAQDESVTQLTYYVRAAQDARSIPTALRQAVQRIDPNLPIFDMKSMRVQVDESLFVERMVAVLSVAFGALATLLAAIGLYGVMSYAVTRRTREIGIRMALGAERRRVLWLVLKEVAVMAAVGITGGLAAAFWLTRQVQAQLFGLAPTDPATLIGAALLLSVIALAAGYFPARRATTIDPLVSLRTE